MLSNAERQAALRERRMRLGLTEVRGIWLPLLLHAKLKAHAQRLLKSALGGSDAKAVAKEQRKKPLKSRA